ncbi:4284_t:CDS:2, partial [Gigaspora margarita]
MEDTEYFTHVFTSPELVNVSSPAQRNSILKICVKKYSLNKKKDDDEIFPILLKLADLGTYPEAEYYLRITKGEAIPNLEYAKQFNIWLQQAARNGYAKAEELCAYFFEFVTFPTLQRIFVMNEPPSTINEYKTFPYGVPSSSENVDNSDINKEIDSDISESESAEDNPYLRLNSRVLVDFRHLKIAQSDKRRLHEKKSASSKLWNNENGCKEMDIQVEYNSWDPYLEPSNRCPAISQGFLTHLW